MPWQNSRNSISPPIPALLFFLGILLLPHHILPSCCFILAFHFQPCLLQTWVKSSGKAWFKCSAGFGPALVGFPDVLEPGLNPKRHHPGLQLSIKIPISARSKNLFPAAPSGGKNMGRWDESIGFPSQFKAWLIQVPVALQGKHPWNSITIYKRCFGVLQPWASCSSLSSPLTSRALISGRREREKLLPNFLAHPCPVLCSFCGSTETPYEGQGPPARESW